MANLVFALLVSFLDVQLEVGDMACQTRNPEYATKHSLVVGCMVEVDGEWHKEFYNKEHRNAN